jgi:hypothetical protein
LADDALRIKPDAPEAASGEDWFADNHLAETLAGKVPNVPIERRCIGAAALNRIYNIDLKECVTSNNDGVLGTRQALASPAIMPKRRARLANSLDSGILEKTARTTGQFNNHHARHFSAALSTSALSLEPMRRREAAFMRRRRAASCPRSKLQPLGEWFQDWRK